MATDFSEDLALAQACARQEAAALARFEELFGSTIRDTARRFGDATFVDEACQRVREHLLVAEPGRRPRISEYRGQAPLLRYLQAVTTRLSLNLTTQARRRPVLPDEALLDVAAPHDGPEVAAIKARLGAQFKAAFAQAMSELDDVARTALRLYYLDGVGLQELGKLYGWSVPTASRRVAAARAAALEATKRQLGEQLQLPPADVESMLRLLESRLSVAGL